MAIWFTCVELDRQGVAETYREHSSYTRGGKITKTIERINREGETIYETKIETKNGFMLETVVGVPSEGRPEYKVAKIYFWRHELMRETPIFFSREECFEDAIEKNRLWFGNAECVNLCDGTTSYPTRKQLVRQVYGYLLSKTINDIRNRDYAEIHGSNIRLKMFGDNHDARFTWHGYVWKHQKDAIRNVNAAMMMSLLRKVCNYFCVSTPGRKIVQKMLNTKAKGWSRSCLYVMLSAYKTLLDRLN